MADIMTRVLGGAPANPAKPLKEDLS